MIDIINDYKNFVGKTAIYPNKVDNFGLAYLWLGLIGESSEFEESLKTNNDTLKEFGDICWYTASICNVLDLEIVEVFMKPVGEYSSHTSGYNPNPNNIYKYCENIKKYYRDSKPIDKSEIQDLLHSNLMRLLFLTGKGYSYMEEAIVLNVEKLKDRQNRNVLNGDGNNR